MQETTRFTDGLKAEEQTLLDAADTAAGSDANAPAATMHLPMAQTADTPALSQDPSLRERIHQRQERLQAAAAALKQELFGLDTLIDRLIDAIRSWYLLPELVERPLVVCLWGLTGTGKTQLARRLAQLLGFYDRYVEVQMDGFSAGSTQSNRDSVAAMLGASSIVEGAPGILLLDEFQRFRTVDKEGKDLAVQRYQDVWALLSDGRLAPSLQTLDRIEMELAYHQYQQAEHATEAANELLDLDSEDERNTAQRKRRQRQRSPFLLSAWDARDIQQALKLREPLLEIMRWTPQQVSARLEAFRANPQAWATDHSKLLILVTGNLDEMYRGIAARVQDCDTDADVFHSLTQKLSSIDVKRALSKRFRPEQVARLGNQHLVFPSLTRSAYERLIAHCCETQLQGLRQRLGCSIQLAPALLQVLYQNAVFPAQGTRPVFSTVQAVLGQSLSQAALWALENVQVWQGASALVESAPSQAQAQAQPQLLLGMAADGKQLCMRLLGQGSPGCSAPVLLERQLPLHLELDQLRRRAQPDFRCLLAVHEAGHGLAYALLSHCAPTEVRINVAAFEGGYASFAPRVAESRRMARDEICVTLAGRAAELWVFGADAVTTGAEEDLSQATRQAAQYQRHWAMGDQLSRVDVCHDTNEHLNTDVAASNLAIEELLQQQMRRALDLLSAARPAFERLVQALLADGYVDAARFAQVTGLVLPARADALEPWEQGWQDFVRAGSATMTASQAL